MLHLENTPIFSQRLAVPISSREAADLLLLTCYPGAVVCGAARTKDLTHQGDGGVGGLGTAEAFE